MLALLLHGDMLTVLAGIAYLIVVYLAITALVIYLLIRYFRRKKEPL